MIDWPAIVHKHSQDVWRIAYRIVGNHADAADCFQETFISALRLSEKERIRNWSAVLSRLATMRALERLRQRHRQRNRHAGPPHEDIAVASETDPLEKVQNDELAENLRRALSQLPEQQAEVFCLRFLEDLSYREIARQLGIKTNAVGVILHRARTRLRELLSCHETGSEGEVSNG